MTVTATAFAHKTAAIAALAQSMVVDIHTAHANTPFETVEAVSYWFSQQYNNPRLKVATDNNDRTIRVTWKGDRFLMINCR